VADLQQMLQDVHRLLGTAACCAWYCDDGVTIHPARCVPAGWMGTDSVLSQPTEDFLFCIEPRAARALLPVGLQLAGGATAVTAVLRVHRQLPDGRILGLTATWGEADVVPADLRLIARTILDTVGPLLCGEAAATELVKDSPQLRSLAGALPQGIVIVPVDGQTGFVNPSAAKLLSLAPGETAASVLAEHLRAFIARARDPETVAAFAARVFSSEGIALDQRTTVWRFDEPPRALRVTISPVRTIRTVAWVWLLDDVSRETLLQEELADSEQKFRQFYQTLSDTVVFYDLSGRCTECNAAMFRLLQMPHTNTVRVSTADLGWDPAEWEQVASECRSTGSSRARERKLLTAGGSVVHVESSAYLRRDSDGGPVGIWEVLHDITDRKNAEAQLILSAEAFARNTEGVILTDADEVILTVNDAFCNASGFSREELRGKKPHMLRSGRHDERFYEQMRRSISQSGWWQGGVWNRNRDGQLFFKWLTVNAVRDEKGVLTHYVGVYRDAVAVRAAKRQIEYMATHDGLTQLPNAMLFEDRLRYAFDHFGQSNGLLGIVVVELLGLQRINGAMGIQAGDAVIKGAAARLRQLSRSVPVVARISGDRFGVLYEAANPEELAKFGKLVLEELNVPYEFEGAAVAAPVCVGISAYPEDGTDPQTLLFNARAALNHARAIGTNGMQFFAAEMSREISKHFQLENGLRQAIERGEFRLAYQPQVSAEDGSVVGCEALLRWQHGSVLESPDTFLPVAEASNLIAPITEWVLRQVCRDMKQWDVQGAVVPTVSVNISARHFQHDDMVPRLLHILQQEGVDPERICLEITEGALASPEQSEGKVDALKEAGFELSVDDFGTGFSSLSYLKRFRLDEIKIDKSFVQGIQKDRGDRALVDAILSMAHGLGLSVVAEGVENQAQVDYLTQRGCTRLQGFLYMRPSDAAALQAYVLSRRGEALRMLPIAARNARHSSPMKASASSVMG